jgi:FkbM family methyltransferase
MVSNRNIPNILFNYFNRKTNGVLVEVGAADPIYISVSFNFRPVSVRKKIWHIKHDPTMEYHGKEPIGNWKIISIEPNPDFCKEFRRCGLEVLEYAACAKDIEYASFKVSPEPMLSSALEVRHPGPHPIINDAGGWWPAEQFKTIGVKALTLNTILARHHPEVNHIDILLIDVEGWELEVLQGLDLDKFKPNVVVLENYNAAYQPYMESNGYKLDRKEEQDWFYVRK